MAFDLGVARGRIEIDTNDLRNVETALGQAGRGVLAFGAVAIAGFGLAVTASAGFEQKLSHIAAVTGANEEQVDRLRQAALKLGQDTAYGATQAAGAFVELSKAGLSVEQILQGAGDAAVQLAAAGDIGIAEAAEVAVNIMQTFNMEASEMVHIADVLAGAANASTIEIEDLAVSFKYAGSVASALGITLEDTATALAILGNNGIRGSTAGTSLRRIMLQLSPTTEKATGALKDLGIITEDGTNKFFTAEGQAKSLSEVFSILQNATKGLTDEQKATALATIFGARAVSSGLILMREGAQGFAEMQEQIGQVTALEVMEKRLDNVAGAFQKFKAALETFLITGGGPFQDVIQRIIEGLTGLLNWFSKLPTPVIVFLTVATLLVGLLAVLAGGFLLTAGTMLRAYRLFVEMGPAMKAVIGLLRAMAAGFARMAVALMTNPIFLVIAAIVALGIALFVLYKKSETFRNFIDGLWQSIQRGWDAILNFFRGLPQWFTDRWNEIKAGISALIDWVKQNWDILLTIFTGPFGLMILVVRRWGDDIVRWVSNAIDTVVGFFTALPGRVINFVTDLLGRIVHEFSQLPERIGYWLGFVIGRFIRFIVDTRNTLIEWREKAAEAILSFFQELPGRVVGFLNQVWDAFYAWALRTWTDAATWSFNIYNGVIQWIQELPGKIVGFLNGIWDGFYAWATKTWTDAAVWSFNIYTGLINWIQQLPGKIAEWFGQLPGKISGFVTQMWDAAWRVGEGVFRGLKDGVGDIWNTISDAFWKVIHAIGGFLTEAKNKARDVGSAIWNGFKDGLGMGSPSHLERAMWGIADEVVKTTAKLGEQVGIVQDYSHQAIPKALGSITAPGILTPPTPIAETTKTEEGMRIEKIEINNPVPEPAEESLTRSMQKLEFAGYFQR